MIALIHGDHMVLIGHAFSNDAPVAGRAIKSVDNQEGWVCPFLSMFDHIQHICALA
jgi:hypothetical protein